MYQEEVMVPVGDWAKARLKKLSETDKIRDESKVESGFGKNISNWVGREMVYPTNVVHMATETNNQGHSAVFPKQLPEWFIKLFTVPGNTVLDPFAGSGTTLFVAHELNRKAIGVEIVAEYVEAIEAQLWHQQRLFEEIMTTELLRAVQDYVEQNTGSFHEKRLDTVRSKRLGDVLSRKNPYLFKAKSQNVIQLVTGIMDAFLSSQEEGLFGNFLEGVAVFVAKEVYGGYKPSTTQLTGIDLVFEKRATVYLVDIKIRTQLGKLKPSQQNVSKL